MVDSSLKLTFYETEERKAAYDSTVTEVKRERVIFAVERLDRSVAETFRDNVLTGDWSVRYKIRQINMAGITTDWSFRDSEGNVYDIESLSEMGNPITQHIIVFGTTRRT